MYFVYTIYNSNYNSKHNKIYIGQTKNLTARLEIHNNRTLKGYTSRFDGDWNIIYYEKLQTRKDALKREKQLKSYRGRQFVKTFIKK